MSLLRQDLRNKFSNFLGISDEKGFNYNWTPDATLRRNIDKVLALTKYYEAIEEELVRHFLHNLHSQNPHIAQISRLHLVAYLQETCIFVCKRLCDKRKGASLKDAFGVANATICEPDFFKNYKSHKAKLATYADRAVRNKVLDFVTGSGRSNWGKFYYLSTKELKENLVSISFLLHRDEEDYIYIHKFYKNICRPSITEETRTEPNIEQLQAICDRYNSVFHNAKSEFVEMTPKKALQMMKDCIEVIRNREKRFANPSDLDAPIKSRADDGQVMPLIDTISDLSDANQNRLEDLEEDELSELEQISTELNLIVNSKLASLDLEKQSIFTLLHGFNCKTPKIGKLYGVNQGTISRRYHRGYDLIHSDCLIFCKQKIGSQDMNDQALIDNLSKWLDNYLDSFYKGYLLNLLNTLLNSRFKNDKQSVHQFQDLTEYINAEGENLIDLAVNLVINYLQNDFQIPQCCNPAIPEIIEFIKTWMRDRPTN